MQFQVPQFLEVEDKLFAFFTFKQFLYITGGLGVAYLVWTYIPWFIIKAPIALALLVFSFALGFVKVNNKPFIFSVQAFLKYISASRLYIWKKIPKKIEPKKPGEGAEDRHDGGVYAPALSESKLRDLAWSLDINDREKGILQR